MASSHPFSTAPIRGLTADSRHVSSRVVALGSFDGIHLGHRQLLEAVVSEARLQGVVASLISFYPHPTLVLGRVRARPPLLGLRQRLRVLSELGFESLIMLRFSKHLSQLSAHDFVTETLVGKLNVGTLFVGPEAALGKGRQAGVRELKDILKESGRELVVFPALEDQGQKIGSRQIRELVITGNIAEANRLLGYQWALEGRVVRGDGRGKSLAIPTANLVTRQLLPAHGVYAGFAEVKDVRYPAVINIGYRPTFSGKNVSIEAHLYSYQGGDFYGERMALEPHQKLRDERRFDGREDLVRQIREDIKQAEQILNWKK